MKRRPNNFMVGDRHNMRNCFSRVTALGGLKHWSRSSMAIHKGTVARHTTGTQTSTSLVEGGGSLPYTNRTILSSGCNISTVVETDSGLGQEPKTQCRNGITQCRAGKWKQTDSRTSLRQCRHPLCSDCFPQSPLP